MVMCICSHSMVDKKKPPLILKGGLDSKTRVDYKNFKNYTLSQAGPATLN
jgi:hypothetical protein